MKYDKKEPKEVIEGPARSILPMPEGMDVNDKTHYYQLMHEGDFIVLYCRGYAILSINAAGALQRYQISSSLREGFLTTHNDLIKLKEGS